MNPLVLKSKTLQKNSFLFLQNNVVKNNITNYFIFNKDTISLYNSYKYIYNRKMITISRKASRSSIRVIRRFNGFPNRGQRTSSNAKTAKKRLKISNL
jgi:ribosomal protein S13